MNKEVYLKIYTEDNDKVLVFEGQGVDDISPYYYPTRWDEIAKRIGTVVVGKEHIRITQSAREAFRRIVREAKKTGDDISCIDIHTCYGRTDDGKIDEERGCMEVCVSYIGDIVTKFNIEEVIRDENFFIGMGEGVPALSLLEAIPDLDNIKE